ncbi:MAG: ASKHA domain-containing protein [Thermodesulfobacteriota bacterium]|nr:ASKHA domain-containing protein [Thermodesulfobacteriota bacterium]
MAEKTSMPLVIFEPSGRRGNVSAGKTIIEAAQDLGADIQNVCGSQAQCGKCKVRIIQGVSANQGNASPTKNLSPIEEGEKSHLNEKQLADGWRLACQARILGDVVVMVPDESRADRQVISKDPGKRKIDLDPAIKQYAVSLTPADLNHPIADWERLSAALGERFGLSGLRVEHSVLMKLPQALRSRNWEVSVSVRHQREVVQISAGLEGKMLGLAVDIGTTSLAVYLCDLNTGEVMATGSMVNPQVAFGEDVMSRISYTMTNPQGTALLSKAIVQGINDLIRDTTIHAGVEASNIVEVVCVGNTCMHHIFIGCDPRNLGKSPFTPVIHHSMDIRADEIGLKVSAGAYVHLLPVIAGFVGADTVGVLIAEEPYHRDEMTLIIDVGTNGELVLGNRNRLICSSCATGPAFEGATIRHGMRAARGAIEAIHIDPSTLEVRLSIIGNTAEEAGQGQVKAKGICGSGIIDGISQMFAAGIVKKNGQFNKELKSPRLRFDSKGPAFIVAWPHETTTGQEIVICLDDVRAIQMAKGAIYAAAKLMMQELGVRHLDRVILAGAFGSLINRKSAAVIGLFPDCELEKVRAVGNAAGDGARLALLNVTKRREADVESAKVEYVELTTRPGFQQEYARAMYFPHMTDKFHHNQD